ncbi:hypothetical protein BKA63DRAFT_401618 [Paraphoma chrysanthemicola]|nr:hypothetical protein BKA63DRAFT_401618 [Paraphoma chrysanthemicola]
MSFFLATVPAGTQLYHGTPNSEPVQGLEWLAFEPEHAMIFARPREPTFRQSPSNRDERPPRTSNYQRGRQDQQHRLELNPESQDDRVGYLHTYVPKHDLNLLYVDGLSAGKTSNGTLDTQDMLLLNLTTGPHGPMGGEHERALGMCNLATSLWEGKIDGILRMEGGFEIILCDFARHLERTDVITVTQHSYWLNESAGFLGGWQYIKAIMGRYHGIGGERVKLAYDDFVSVFSYPDLKGLFSNDVQSDYAMPRLQNVMESDLERVRHDITRMVLRKDWDGVASSRDWQAVADLVVARYSEPLHYLHTNKKLRGDKKALQFYLINILHPFIDYTARNATLETQRCIAQVVLPLPTPPSTAASLAHRAIHDVAHHICDTLLTGLSIASASISHASFTQVYAEHVTDIIDNLVAYLNWTTWKQCGTCADEEVCYVPIWPMGNHEDHANPKCMDEDTARNRWGYWGQGPMGPPPPGEGDDGERRHRMGRFQ